MATTKKYLDSDGLVKYTTLVKNEIKKGVTDISGDNSTPSYDSDVNAVAVTRNVTYTKNGTTATYPYKDTTYGGASQTKDGLMTHEDKEKLDGIESGAVKVTVDAAMSTTSTNPVQNKVVDTAVKAAAKTVRLTVLPDDSTSASVGDYPILTSPTTSPTSGNNSEASYSGAVTINPKAKKITITSGSSRNVIDANGVSGRALQTETDLGNRTGAEMVGYSHSGEHQKEGFDGLVNVSDALNALIQYVDEMSLDGNNVSVEVDGTNIDITSGDSINTVVAAIDSALGNKQDTLTAGSNISISEGTISAADEKVNQTVVPGTAVTEIPLLMANGSTPTNGGVQYDMSLKFNPATQVLKIGDGTLTASEFSGTANYAERASGDSDTIKNTYATKAALDALESRFTGSFQIVTTLPTADGTHGGIIYLIKDTEHGDASSNIFIEYIEVKDGNTWKFESLGTTDAGVDVVSLTDTEIDSIWANPDAA